MDRQTYERGDERLGGWAGQRAGGWVGGHMDICVCTRLDASAAVSSATFLKEGGSNVTWSCDKDCKGWEDGETCKMMLGKKQLTGPMPAAIGLLTCKDMITTMYRSLGRLLSVACGIAPLFGCLAVSMPCAACSAACFSTTS